MFHLDTSSTEQVKPEPKKETVVVVGLGPVGEAYIAKLIDLKVNVNIIVVEIRSEKFTRLQRINDIKPAFVNNEDTWEGFLKFLYNFNNIVSDEGELLETHTSKEIKMVTVHQKFMRKLLRQSLFDLCRHPPKIKNFSLKQLQETLLDYIKTASKENGVPISWHTDSTIDEIHFDKKQLSIKSKSGKTDLYDFDTLVICEGSHREVAKQVEMILKERNFGVEPFHFELFPYQLPQYNSALSLTIKLPPEFLNYRDYLASERKKNLHVTKEDLINKATLMGWKPHTDKIESPLYAYVDNLYKKDLEIEKWVPHIYIVSEFPECIAKLHNHEERYSHVIKWMKMLASYHLGIPEDCFSVDPRAEAKHGFQSTCVFETFYDYVDNPVRVLPNGVKIALLGDTSKKSIYMGGFFSTLGLKEATTLASCFKNPSVDDPDRFKPLVDLYNINKNKIEIMLTQESSGRPLYKWTKQLFFNDKKNATQESVSSQLTNHKTLAN